MAKEIINLISISNLIESVYIYVPLFQQRAGGGRVRAAAQPSVAVRRVHWGRWAVRRASTPTPSRYAGENIGLCTYWLQRLDGRTIWERWPAAVQDRKSWRVQGEIYFQQWMRVTWWKVTGWWTPCKGLSKAACCGPMGPLITLFCSPHQHHVVNYKFWSRSFFGPVEN